MGQNKPFSIVFYTLNLSKNTGGERKELKNCVLVPQAHNMYENDTIGIRSEGAEHDVCVHVRLIVEVNGERIKW